MICTSVVLCFSTDLAKSDKICLFFHFVPCLFHFSGFFGHFEILAFFPKWGDKPYTKAVKHDILVNF